MQHHSPRLSQVHSPGDRLGCRRHPGRTLNIPRPPTSTCCNTCPFHTQRASSYLSPSKTGQERGQRSDCTVPLPSPSPRRVVHLRQGGPVTTSMGFRPRNSHGVRQAAGAQQDPACSRRPPKPVTFAIVTFCHSPGRSEVRVEAHSPHSTDRTLPLGTQEGPDALPRGRKAGKMSMRGVGSAAAPGFEDPGL